MTKAKNKTEFREAWTSEFNQLGALAQSLPINTVALDFLREIETLKDKYIDLACAESFPKSCFGYMCDTIVEAEICTKHCKTFEERQSCAMQTAEIVAAEQESWSALSDSYFLCLGGNYVGSYPNLPEVQAAMDRLTPQKNGRCFFVIKGQIAFYEGLDKDVPQSWLLKLQDLL